MGRKQSKTAAVDLTETLRERVILQSLHLYVKEQGDIYFTSPFAFVFMSEQTEVGVGCKDSFRESIMSLDVCFVCDMARTQSSRKWDPTNPDSGKKNIYIFTEKRDIDKVN